MLQNYDLEYRESSCYMQEKYSLEGPRKPALTYFLDGCVATTVFLNASNETPIACAHNAN